MMLLPGGVVRDGERRRQFTFRPLDGALEVEVAEASSTGSAPAAVTAALCASLAEIGGGPVTADVVRALSVGDRQFLARQLSIRLGRDPVWMTAPCGSCGVEFDMEVRQAELPVKEAGAGYPYAEIEAAGVPMRLRVPNGADQEAIADLAEPEAVETLFERCVVAGDAATVGTGDRVVAEAAIEAASPEVALGVLAICPTCGASTEISVDPYLGLWADADEVFAEVHHLAWHYHWSEAEILHLPPARRQRYLELVDHARGLMQ